MQKNNIIIKAVNKNVRSSPRKLSLVLNHIKGKKADLALRDLEFTRKKLPKMLVKLLNPLYQMQKIIISMTLTIFL